jgi:hypothetical protein
MVAHWRSSPCCTQYQEVALWGSVRIRRDLQPGKRWKTANSGRDAADSIGVQIAGESMSRRVRWDTSAAKEFSLRKTYSKASRGAFATESGTLVIWLEGRYLQHRHKRNAAQAHRGRNRCITCSSARLVNPPAGNRKLLISFS